MEVHYDIIEIEVNHWDNGMRKSLIMKWYIMDLGHYDIIDIIEWTSLGIMEWYIMISARTRLVIMEVLMISDNGMVHYDIIDRTSLRIMEWIGRPWDNGMVHYDIIARTNCDNRYYYIKPWNNGVIHYDIIKIGQALQDNGMVHYDITVRGTSLVIMEWYLTYLGRLLLNGFGTFVRATCVIKGQLLKRQLLKQPQNAIAAVFAKMGNLDSQLKLFYDDLNVILFHGSGKWCFENIDMIENFCKRILKDHRSRGFPQEINVILRKLSICSRNVKYENKAIGCVNQLYRVYLFQKLVRTILMIER
ncbi:unnamed protein product [Mytilus edulis]|uniref:Uncharacterized protein n=1 Tax=Mytilus edulis TaxID=6550 RepID=A0A8S3SY70_MYTED|nr:unnamed protein product [Mytilus edulis]